MARIGHPSEVASAMSRLVRSTRGRSPRLPWTGPASSPRRAGGPHRMTRRLRVPARPRRAAAVLRALLFGSSRALAAGMPVAAATPSTVGAQIVGWVNQARVARGLRELRTDVRLSAMAADRARILADANLL